jgi:hypothetical protein
MVLGARAAFVVSLVLATSCGRSVQNGSDGDGAAGESSSGSSGTTGGRGGESGTPGNGGTAGESSGGSSGTTGGRGGESGTPGNGGTAGESNDGPRLFFESGGALLGGDLSGGELFELFPGAEGPVRYTLAGTDGDSTMVLRESLTDSGTLSTSLLRVANNGLAFSVVYTGSIVSVLSPVIDGRVVMIVPGTETLEPLPGAPPPKGLASVRTDGTGFEALEPLKVTQARIVGGRVLFANTESEAPELYTVRADGTDRKTVVPTPDFGWCLSNETRLVCDANGDVFSVEPDGSGRVELAVGPERDHANSFAGDRVVINRLVEPEPATQLDLYAVPVDGGELLPFATGPQTESFDGVSGDRLVYSVNGNDVFSVRLDGSDPRAIASSGEQEYVEDIENDHVLVGRLSADGAAALGSASSDGSNVVTLTDNYSGSPAIVGDRVVTNLPSTNDVVSFPLAGGDPVTLAAGVTHGEVVGRIGRTLILQTRTTDASGEVFRIEADGSDRRVFLPLGNYVGAITERCGVVSSNIRFPCEEP